MHKLARPLGLAVLAVACGGGTAQNQHGDLSANTRGSLPFELAARSAPDADLLGSCGDGALSEMGKTTLKRLPFLQQVTSESALVVFQTVQPTAVDVDVTGADGTPLASVTSEADPSVRDDTQQMVRITGLEPAHTYCYSLDGLTAAAGFRTAPAPGDGASVRFVAFGGGSAAAEDNGAAASDVTAATHALTKIDPTWEDAASTCLGPPTTHAP